MKPQLQTQQQPTTPPTANASEPIGAWIDGETPWALELNDAHLQTAAAQALASAALRGEPLKQSSSAFLTALHARMEAERVTMDATNSIAALALSTAQNGKNALENMPTVVVGHNATAANDSRWKLVAGFASVAAVGAMAWALVAQPRGESALVASTSPATQAAGELVAQPVLVGGQSAVMLRDAAVMERLAQHRQLGHGMLHGNAGFLRNATFEVPQGTAPAGAQGQR